MKINKTATKTKNMFIFFDFFNKKTQKIWTKILKNMSQKIEKYGQKT